MKYLITGGLGFIGSNLIHYLFKKYPDCEILNVDKESYCSNYDNLNGIIGKYFFSKTDIGDPYISTLLKGFKPDVVINLAAQTHVDRSVRNPKEFIETDINGVFNLVYHSMKYGLKKFIHISTDEVYGPIPTYLFRREDDNGTGGQLLVQSIGEANENAKLNPTSPYAASKAAGDLLLSSYIKTYDFPAIIIRPCNNYGPRQYPEKLIPMTVTQLLQNEKIILHGEGKEIREWIYVDDCCRAIDNITNKGRIGEIYNVGSGDRITNINIIRQAIRTLFGKVDGVDSFIKRIPNRPGNDKRYAVDSRKTIKECGEYHLVPINLGMQMTTKWYEKNREWWQKLNVDLSSNIYSEENYLR